MHEVRISRSLDSLGLWASVALGFSIPISVAFDNLLLVMVAICWIFSGNYRCKWTSVSQNPVSVMALFLFGLLALGLFASDQPIRESVNILLKYSDLLFIPLFAYYFREQKYRQRALYAFGISMGVILTLSYFLKTGVIGPTGLLRGSEQSPVVFKFRVTHNYFMAFGAFTFTWLALNAPKKSVMRAVFGGAAILACANVVFMVAGVTGYITLAALAAWAMASLLPRRLALGGLVATTMGIIVLLNVPSTISNRVESLGREFNAWSPGVAQRDSSAGLRLEFWDNTLKVIVDNPILGVGTGAFASAYAEKVLGTDMVPATNPHNEYLMITAQIGLLGLVTMITLLVSQWRAAPLLASPMERNLARGLVLAMSVGCIFNSFLLDHAEGLFYAWLSGLLFAGLPGKKTTGISS